MLVTIDFETYYDRNYSLSKLTTEEYVRDPRFEVIGVGVKVGDRDATWFSGTMGEIRAYLRGLGLSKAVVLAHNTMFDGAILSWHFGITPVGWLDTLCMARALHGANVRGSLAALAERYAIGVKGTEVNNALGKRRADFTVEDLAGYGVYCRNDVDLTRMLFDVLRQKFPPGELDVIDITLKMFIDPELELDTGALEQHLAEVQDKKQKLLAAVGVHKDLLMSNDKFATLLQSLGVTPPRKISARTGKEAWAFAKTDEEFKALGDHEDPRVQTLIAARLGNKTTLEETRAQRLLDVATRGKFPVQLKYYAAHTGRWGGDGALNIQNLPSRGANAGKIKSAILAPPGYVLVDADSAQIEARVVSWLAGQNDLVEAFERGDDVYTTMAATIYNKPPEEITPAERFVGKTTILGAGYGMGGARFQVQLKTVGVDIDLEECSRIIAVYRQTYPMVPALWRQAQACLQALVNGYTAPFGAVDVVLLDPTQSGFLLPSGLYQRYEGVHIVRDAEGREQFQYKTRAGLVKIYGGKVVENICQGIARCVIAEQMRKIASRYKVVLTVHDAVTCIAPVEEQEAAVAYVQECMSWRPEWASTLPLACKVSCGENYGKG